MSTVVDLPGARWAEEPVDLPRRHLKVDPVHRARPLAELTDEFLDDDAVVRAHSATVVAGASQTAAGGEVTPAEKGRSWHRLGRSTPPRLPTPEPPYSFGVRVQHLAPTAARARGTGRQWCRTSGEKLTRQASTRVPSAERAYATRCPHARRRPATGTRRVGSRPPQGRLRAVDAVEVGDAPQHAAVQRVVEHVPVEAGLRPSVPCPISPPMNRSCLPGCPHMWAYSARKVERLPLVAGGLPQAPLVHDLVVGERQDEVLVPRVDHREGQLVVVPPTVDGLVRDVVERVVHPAHVPLEREPEPTFGRPGDTRPGRRLLGDHRDAGCAACTTAFSSCRNDTASRSSRPPKRFGSHSPGARE